MIIEKKEMHNKYNIFESRVEAGEKLADLVKSEEVDVLEIIPNGGLPIGFGLIKKHNLNFDIDLLIVKKIHMPHSTEAGMGAITPDGDIFLNERLISSYSINDKQIESQIKQTLDRINLIKAKFGIEHEIILKNKIALIIDDGIASGFSMMAGANWMYKKGAKKVLIGTPTAPLSSLQSLEGKVDKIFCLNIREGFSFAVADAYKNWYDLSLEEAIDYFKKIKGIITKK